MQFILSTLGVLASLAVGWLLVNHFRGSPKNPEDHAWHGPPPVPIVYKIPEKYINCISKSEPADGIPAREVGEHFLESESIGNNSKDNVAINIDQFCRKLYNQLLTDRGEEAKQSIDKPMHFFHGGKSDYMKYKNELWTEADLGQDKLFWPGRSALKYFFRARCCLEDAPEFIGHVIVWEITNKRFYDNGCVTVKLHDKFDVPPGSMGDWSIGARTGYEHTRTCWRKDLNKCPDAYIFSSTCVKNAGLKPSLVVKIRNPYFGKERVWQWQHENGTWRDYNLDCQVKLEQHYKDFHAGKSVTPAVVLDVGGGIPFWVDVSANKQTTIHRVSDVRRALA